ncbi:MAG: sugar phosphate nucleotidyltransferase [Gemmatimonadaceae bacterium]|jgi:glucose-1-phosphate thymidylyltransferase|nr:sugar phosphate nucleotidyltransferase [Gemmatimonadaceae bacterium]
MTITRAVVLAAGLGTRMQAAAPGTVLDAAQAAAADAGIKALVPVGRPLLDHLLASLADAGITEVCLVVGPSTGAAIRAHVATLQPTRLAIAFAEQAAPRGTADALLAAATWVGAAPFLVLNADNLYPTAAIRALTTLDGEGVIGWPAATLVAEGNIPAERIRRFALLVPDAAGDLVALVEKPDEADRARLGEGALVGMNLWAFTPAILEACRRTTPSVRGELELPEAVRLAITTLGRRVRVVVGTGGVLDLSSRHDIADVAARLAGRPVVV